MTLFSYSIIDGSESDFAGKPFCGTQTEYKKPYILGATITSRKEKKNEKYR